MNVFIFLHILLTCPVQNDLGEWTRITCPSASIYFYSLLCISFRLICFILAALANITTSRKLGRCLFCCFLSIVSDVFHKPEDVSSVLGVTLMICAWPSLVLSPHALYRAISPRVYKCVQCSQWRLEPWLWQVTQFHFCTSLWIGGCCAFVFQWKCMGFQLPKGQKGSTNLICGTDILSQAPWVKRILTPFVRTALCVFLPRDLSLTNPFLIALHILHFFNTDSPLLLIWRLCNYVRGGF